MKINLQNFSAVIFDMDGTMVDNMPYHERAWHLFLDKYHLTVPQKLFKQLYSGKKNTFILPNLFKKELTPSQIKKYSLEKEKLYHQLYSVQIKPIAGLIKILDYLKSHHFLLAVATTAPKPNRELVFRQLNIKNYFKIILGDEDVTKGKPDPEIYLKTAQKLSVDPKQCLVFEDSPAGVTAASLAGMTVAAILTSHTKKELPNADYFFKDFQQIGLL